MMLLGIIVLHVVLVPTFCVKIPPYIKVCKSGDPNLENCIANSVNLLRDRLRDGIPELGVPKVEPLHLDEIKIRSGPNAAQISANITNIQVTGPSKFELLALKPNVPKNKFAFKFKVPFLHFEGDYDIDMKILFLSYSGKGPIIGNFTNYTFDCILKGNKIQKQGVDYLKFGKMALRLNVGPSTIHLGNLFGDSPLIEGATRRIINDNADLFINEIKPNLENSLAEKFTEIANKITLNIPYDELFPQ